ncbi:MAG: hypothetical protein GWN17_07805 [Candidatus Korarchaeota archaeon]|nr:hypothetical protein [Candidatus Thorarchaeota archaeon]NIW52113.1 hypothetical protein [Candidatus Korarchaeota archaeon]
MKSIPNGPGTAGATVRNERKKFLTTMMIIMTEVVGVRSSSSMMELDMLTRGYWVFTQVKT